MLLPFVFVATVSARRADKAVEETELSAENIEMIVNSPKSERPDLSIYFSKDYIDKHLSMFKDGGSFVMTRKQYKIFVEGKLLIDCYDNSQFIAPKSYMGHIVEVYNGDISVYEKMLGFDEGYFQSEGRLVRFDIKDSCNLNLRIPSRNEYGANVPIDVTQIISKGVYRVYLEQPELYIDRRIEEALLEMIDREFLICIVPY